MRILRSDQTDEWMDVLGRCLKHDFYHLPSYHRLEEKRTASAAHLFVYEEMGYTIAFPILLRSLQSEPWMESMSGDFKDAISVYGYAGPICSHTEVPDHVCERFRSELKECLLNVGVVSLFSRLHPLISNGALLSGLGELRAIGKTISIDLTLPEETLWKQTRKCHRDRVRKLRDMEMRCIEDRELIYLPDFARIYEETMRRVGADEMYFFGRDYFEEFARELGHHNHLFVAMLDDEVVAGALFINCNNIVQYHLSGTKTKFRALSPTTLILDTARRWAAEQRFQHLHLGGGVGSKEDSLFHFKGGFSDRRHDYMCRRWVVCEETYADLCDRAEAYSLQKGLVRAAPGFFPDYRRPIVPEHERELV